jgi:hypothetical protein
MDYALVHAGRAFTPNQTPLATADVEAHNAALLAGEIAEWATQPDRFAGYVVEATDPCNPRDTRPKAGAHRRCTLTTWTGDLIGHGDVCATWNALQGWLWRVTIRGTNGAAYWGVMGANTQLVRLRKYRTGA